MCKRGLKSIASFLFPKLKRPSHFYFHICGVKYFCTVTRTHAALFSKKVVFSNLTLFFILATRDTCTKLLTFSKSSVKIKVKSFFYIFHNFVYISSCLQTKSFTCKQDSAIFSKLQMLWRWTRSFWKALIELYKVHEKERPQNGRYKFQRPFKFSTK